MCPSKIKGRQGLRTQQRTVRTEGHVWPANEDVCCSVYILLEDTEVTKHNLGITIKTKLDVNHKRKNGYVMQPKPAVMEAQFQMSPLAEKRQEMLGMGTIRRRRLLGCHRVEWQWERQPACKSNVEAGRQDWLSTSGKWTRETCCFEKATSEQDRVDVCRRQASADWNTPGREREQLWLVFVCLQLQGCGQESHKLIPRKHVWACLVVGAQLWYRRL